jgi:hypothetical protein
MKPPPKSDGVDMDAEIANDFESQHTTHRCRYVLDYETPLTYESMAPWRRAGNSVQPKIDGVLR